MRVRVRVRMRSAGRQLPQLTPPCRPFPCRQFASIRAWVQSEFPAFAGKAVSFTLCFSHFDAVGNANTYSYEQFHAGCDGKGPTVTIIKTEGTYRGIHTGHEHCESHVPLTPGQEPPCEPRIFGAASMIDWGDFTEYMGGGTYIQTPHAFMFCLNCNGATGHVKVNQGGLEDSGDAPDSTTCKVNGQTQQIKCSPNLAGSPSAVMSGPTAHPKFGGGHDFGIGSNPREGSNAGGFGTSYECPVGSMGSPECANYFDKVAFNIADMEVFALA